MYRTKSTVRVVINWGVADLCAFKILKINLALLDANCTSHCVKRMWQLWIKSGWDQWVVIFLWELGVSSSSSIQCFDDSTECVHTYIHPLNVWAGARKVKPIWILLKQGTVSGSGITWAVCKSAPRSRQITMPAFHHWVFYGPDALPAAQPTASKHWRH